MTTISDLCSQGYIIHLTKNLVVLEFEGFREEMVVNSKAMAVRRNDRPLHEVLDFMVEIIDKKISKREFKR